MPNNTEGRTRTDWVRLLSLPVAALFLALGAIVGSVLAGNTTAAVRASNVEMNQQVEHQVPAGTEQVKDAFLVLLPQGSAPPNGGTVNVGDRFVLEMWVNAGSNEDATAQQSYLTFTQSILQNASVASIGSACNLSNTVAADTTTFEAVLQNQVCNGPNPCTGHTEPDPGSIGFASGALTNPAAGGTFRVAQIGLCAVAPGQAVIHWQFSPPGPPNRDTKIVGLESGDITGQDLFTDYLINVSGATNTPTPTSIATPSGTRTATVTPCPMTFTDVQPTDYFYEPVRYLYCAGAISGYADNTFRPFNTTTRGQLSKIVVLAEGWSIDTTGGPHFNDVPQDNTFYGFIETAYNRGIISGYACGGPGEPCPGLYFRWGNNVTRGQLSKIVVLAEGWSIDTTGGPHFNDVPLADPFYGFIETAFNRGVISGYADGTFRPGNNSTRGQIAKIVYNALLSLP